MEGLWDELASLEPGGGGSGDQDRIYNLTVRGAQLGMIDDEPQGPSVYDDVSMHQWLWGTASLVHSHLADAGMMPLVEQMQHAASQAEVSKIKAARNEKLVELASNRDRLLIEFIKTKTDKETLLGWCREFDACGVV